MGAGRGRGIIFFGGVPVFGLAAASNTAATPSVRFADTSPIKGEDKRCAFVPPLDGGDIAKGGFSDAFDHQSNSVPQTKPEPAFKAAPVVSDGGGSDTRATGNRTSKR
jgi:hypothetical protein